MNALLDTLSYILVDTPKHFKRERDVGNKLSISHKKNFGTML